MISQIVSDRPRKDGASCLRQEPTPRRRHEDAEDYHRQAAAEEPRRRSGRGADAGRRASVGRRAPGTGSRCTTMTSPAKTQRHEKYVVMSRRSPGRRRRRWQRPPRSARRPGRSVGGKLPPPADDGRHDEDGADALKERPADEQHGEIRARARSSSSPAVDDESTENARLRPMMLPILPPTITRLAMTRVYRVIAVWMPARWYRRHPRRWRWRRSSRTSRGP